MDNISTMNLWQKLAYARDNLDPLFLEELKGSGVKGLAANRVYDACRRALAAARIVIVDSGHQAEIDERTVKNEKYNTSKQVARVTMDFRYRIVNIDKPEEVEECTWSYTAIDQQGINFAVSITSTFAKKSFLLSLLLATGEEYDPFEIADDPSNQRSWPSLRNRDAGVKKYSGKPWCALPLDELRYQQKNGSYPNDVFAGWEVAYREEHKGGGGDAQPTPEPEPRPPLGDPAMRQRPDYAARIAAMKNITQDDRKSLEATAVRINAGQDTPELKKQYAAMLDDRLHRFETEPNYSVPSAAQQARIKELREKHGGTFTLNEETAEHYSDKRTRFVVNLSYTETARLIKDMEA